MTAATTLDFDRTRKNLDRRLNATMLSPRKSAVLMPSHQALDVRELLTAGVLTRDTKQWWVEMNPVIALKLEAVKTELDLPNVTIVQGKLEDFDPPEPLDYVNADMMSAFTPELAAWFERIEPKLLDDAVIVVNYTRYQRRGDFINWLFDVVVKRIGADESFLAVVDTFMVRSQILDVEDVVPRIMLCCALSNRHFDWFNGHLYRDKRVTMASMRVDNLRPHENSPWPAISHLIETFEDQRIRNTRASPQPKAKDTKASAPATLRELQEHIAVKHHMLLDQDLNTGAWELRMPSTGKVVASYATVSEIMRLFEGE